MGVRAVSPRQDVEHPGYVTGRWYSARIWATPLSAAVAADTLYLFPVPVHSTVTIDRLAVTVGTLAVGNVKLGLYTNVNGVPSALIAECSSAGDMNQAANTNVELSFSANPTLPRGTYWLASLFSAATASPLVAAQNTMQAGGISWQLGGTSLGTLARVTGGVPPARVTQTAAATYASGMPTTCGAVTYGAGSPGSPIMGFRVA